jgi:DNA ligase-1
MLFAELTSVSRRIGATRARLEKTSVLAGLLRRLASDEIDPAVAFLSGQLRQGRIGLGPAAAREAMRGTAAAGEPALSIAEVDATFTRIAGVSGAGSTGERQRLFGGLLARATEEEREILVRLVLGELRQGALEGLMAEALASASEVPAAEVRRALMLSGDLMAVARAVLVDGRAGLGRFRLEMFRPLQPMLAQPASDVDEALGRLGEAAFEYKLDGARVQVHRADDEVRVFTRGLNEVTEAVPELVEVVRALPARDLILDGEVLALRPDGTPHPFQATMRRFGRKLDVESVRKELPLTPYFFDLIRLDGADLFDAPACERIATLGGLAPGLTVPRLVTADAAAAEAFFDEALARGHEGVMAKDDASLYEAGSRGFSWLKVKPAHTLDLVVLAVEWGNGRRSEWLSNIHLGARDEATGAFLMLGKTFKGMTDAMLAWQTKRFQELAVATDGYTVQVRPEQVVEIAFSDVQASPQYPSGMALRFARVKRYRDDKTAAQADTVATVRAILEGRRPKSRLP